MRRDLRNINVARRPGLLSCILHTFFGMNLPNLLPANWLTPAGLTAFFFFLPYWEATTFSVCRKQTRVLQRPGRSRRRGSERLPPPPPHPPQPERRLGRVSPPLTHFGAGILSPRLAVNFVSSWPELVAVGRRRSLRLVGFLRLRMQSSAPLLYVLFFCGGCVILWSMALCFALVCSFLWEFEGIWRWLQFCWYHCDKSVFRRLFSSELQQPIIFADRASRVRVLTNWQFFFFLFCLKVCMLHWVLMNQKEKWWKQWAVTAGLELIHPGISFYYLMTFRLQPLCNKTAAVLFSAFYFWRIWN